MNQQILPNILPEIETNQQHESVEVAIRLLSQTQGVYIFRLSCTSLQPIHPAAITLRWKLPYLHAKGVWKSDSVHNKRQQYDWELEHLVSRISVNAPVISVFGTKDQNIITFALSEVINQTEMNAMLREEDNHLYCHVTLFQEPTDPITDYEMDLRVDMRKIHFGVAMQETAAWWATMPGLRPASVPALAKAPLYSTWYQFHQSLDETILLEELVIAQKIGLELVILDDGWQTHDSNRGYDYTGDWQPERIPQMAEFVSQIQQLGMKAGLWFSVPFCGKQSKAFQSFEGKYLTESHRWAPVFDVRFPEVRAYLTNLYLKALTTWGLDALKLDFIDDFQVYEETSFEMGTGRDFISVNEAVDALMTDIHVQLSAINPEVAIEFRQRYVGPAMRKFGNMFRAFDCPNDPITNRIRITDVKLLAGNTAVHSDPITWHPQDTIENAAIQLLNSMFGVPQISMELRLLPSEQLQMLAHYLAYWKKHRSILLEGQFTPHMPLSNYPVLEAKKDQHTILVAYDPLILDISLHPGSRVDIFNATDGERLLLKMNQDAPDFHIEGYSCLGAASDPKCLALGTQYYQIQIPRGGHARLTTTR